MIGVRLAPMAGITDWPFRVLCFEQGCDCATTEMVSALGYVYAPKNNRANQALMRRDPREPKLLLQLFGKEPAYMERAAAEISATGRYEGIDINMGCPARKVACGGEGSGLMRDPALAGEIMRAVVRASAVPVSVKMRLGWDAATVNAVEMARLAEDCGVSEIAVHGRSRMQMYAGEADWEAIAAVKRAVKVPVIGNGDIFAAGDALRFAQMSGVDGVMIGRGALGNPWIFAQVKALLAGREPILPSLEERIGMALRHMEMQLSWKPEHVAVAEMRKHVGWYLHGVRGAARLRARINVMEKPEEVQAALLGLLDEQEA